MELKRVVVTGLGALTPLGNDVSQTWKGLVDGVSGAGPITHFDASNFKTHFACELKDFDVTRYIDRKEARKMDPYAQYALIASEEGVKDSGLDLEKEDLSRIGVIWGSGIGGLLTFHQEVMGFANGGGTPRSNPFFIPKMIADIASGHISIKFGFRGPNFTTVAACASSAVALVDAFNYIRLGKSDVIVTGGSEAPIAEPGVGGFNSLQAISTRNDDPKTASRPFDKDRDGFVMGEGAGCIVLEELEHAKARGAKIYAEFVGGGLSADAYHMTAPHPEGIPASRAMKQALSEAGFDPEKDTLYINAHGTSTPLNDKTETAAIKLALGDETAHKAIISSTKSMTGHMLGATGAVELIASTLALVNGIVPPTIGLTDPDPECDLDYTPNTARKADLTIAMSNTLGFGGHNATVALRKW